MVGGKGSQQGGAERRLQDLGIQLPAAPTSFGTYVETVQTGNLLFFSGMLPVVDHKPKYVGRLGKELDTETGRDAAYTAALSVLAAAKEHLGSLDRVTRVVRLGVFMATSGDFFAINLWVSTEDQGAHTSGSEAFARSLAPLAGYIQALGGTLPDYKPHVPIKFEDQVRVLLDAKVPVFSFIYGIPPKEIFDECRAQGILTIGVATTPDEAIVLEQAGVDIIVASGFEAGGHRGSFLLPAEESLTGTFSLVPQVADAVSVPVVAAGGIADARGIVAAFALGAEGVQIGTAFLACEESGASVHHRNALLKGKARRTGLTRGFTGRLARGIHNQLLEELNRPGVEILPFPLQRAVVRGLSIPAEKAAKPEFLPLWAGQSANLSRQSDAKALLQTLVSGVSAIAGPVLRWNRERDDK